jgi:hypothetical protein
VWLPRRSKPGAPSAAGAVKIKGVLSMKRFVVLGSLLAGALLLGACAGAGVVGEPPTATVTPASSTATPTPLPASQTEAEGTDQADVDPTPTATPSPPPATPTARPNLEATDPTTVTLGAGRPTLIEFFAFW